MKHLIHTAVVTLFAASVAHAQQAVQWKVSDGGNGHWYELPSQQLAWNEAQDLAVSRGAHLVTYASGAEQDFVWSTFTAQISPNPFFIGCFQEPGSCEPGCGWRWVTNEPLDYSRWLPGNPNDNRVNGDENVVCINGSNLWNDLAGQLPVRFVMEWDADCNGDGLVDYGQIADGTYPDGNGDGTPDCCENGASCTADPLSAGLQAYLKFDGDCVDSSVFGRNGAPTGIQFTRDRFNSPGKAAHFDGVTADVQIHGIPIPSNNAFSWALWLRIEPMPYGISGVPILQRIESVGNNLMSPSVWLRADGRISFVSYQIGTGGWDLDTPSEAVVPGQWAHVAFTSAASGDRRIYLNGTLVAQGVAPNYGQELGLLLVGRDRLDSNPRLRAAIDELRVYDRTLSAAEVVIVRDVGGPVGPTCVDADIYRDFNVNGADLGILLSQWGPNTPLTESDLNNDGVVNGADLGLLLSFWGSCP